NLAHVLEQVGKDKGLDKSILIEVLEAAMMRAAEKRYGADKDIESHYNEELGEVELFQFKTVVEEVTEEETEIDLEEAKKLDPDVIIGDSLGVKLDTSGFGRIDAQTVRQIIIQKVREAERDIIYEEYSSKSGEVVSGIIQRFERGDAIVDLGRCEAFLPRREQVRREGYRIGERIRALIIEVRKESKGPQIILSRTHSDFLVKLFETEVPEIYEGIVEVKGAAREPGDRAKIAVVSHDSAVDPVGACVGIKGSRVQVVVQELRGEKIDIVPWSDEPALFTKNALSPAQIARVIVDDDEHSMEVIVPDDQLSLAIGKRGQNVRLAARLVGWKVDIRSETETKAEAMSPEEALRREVEAAAERRGEELGQDVETLPGVGPKLGELLRRGGYNTVADLRGASLEELSKVDGIGEKRAEKLIEAVQEMAGEEGEGD
ncbi:MAG: transcription termination factor NusA, partial [Thermodesulfobacteriota bacterium]